MRTRAGSAAAAFAAFFAGALLFALTGATPTGSMSTEPHRGHSGPVFAFGDTLKRFSHSMHSTATLAGLAAAFFFAGSRTSTGGGCGIRGFAGGRTGGRLIFGWGMVARPFFLSASSTLLRFDKISEVGCGLVESDGERGRRRRAPCLLSKQAHDLGAVFGRCVDR